MLKQVAGQIAYFDSAACSAFQSSAPVKILLHVKLENEMTHPSSVAMPEERSASKLAELCALLHRGCSNRAGVWHSHAVRFAMDAARGRRH